MMGRASQRGGEIVVGVSGASGSRLALRFLETLAPRPEIGRVHFVATEPALAVARAEIDDRIVDARAFLARARLAPRTRTKIAIHDDGDLTAPISSGSYPTAGMAVVPCSAGTLGAIAAGISRGLLQRAADVHLKERRPLVLAFRESPLSLVHAENVRRVTLAGAIVAPPVPPFYLSTFDAEIWIDSMVSRLVSLLGFPNDRADLRWEGRAGRIPRRGSRTRG